MSFYEKDKPTNKKSFNVKLKKQHKRCFIHFSHLLVSTGLIFYLTPSWRTRFVLLTNKIRMFVTIGYASGASEIGLYSPVSLNLANQIRMFVTIRYVPRTSGNGTLTSGNLRKFCPQVQLTLQTYISVLCRCTRPHGYSVAWLEIFR